MRRASNDTPEQRWSLIVEVFSAAVALPRGERDAWVETACAGQTDVCHEIIAMLDAHESGTPLLLEAESPATDVKRSTHPELSAGAIIGAWRVVELAGQGGMGEVYRAERADGAYRQVVAIKVLRQGYHTAETVRRFQVERQALARLTHPSIASILDGGSLPDGRPYLVLQFVEGEPITKYCDRLQHGLTQRLRLFVHVARAVAFAHAQLVIHRDLKPSNILVEADGTPQLLDFGIARMLDPTLDAVLVGPTRPEARLLTPEYAAPEQLRSEPCDTRTDVYGLGILLFELLTGRTPFPAEHRTARELEHTILEDPAPLASGVANGQRQRRELQGDLDVILSMALRKEPDRRYGSATQLADDVERYLTGMPVHAQPDRLGYRVRKFLRRNRSLVGGVAGAGLAILAFAVIATIQARRAARERDRAEQERAVAADVVQILTGLFERSDPRKIPGGDTVRVAALLEEAEQRIEALSQAPERQAAMLRVVGQMHSSRGRYERAETLLRRSATMQWLLRGRDDLEAARTYHEVARAVFAYRGSDASQPLFDSSLARFRRLGESSGPDVRTALLDLAIATPDRERARALVGEVVAIDARTPGTDSMAIAERLHVQATQRLALGRSAEAVALFDEVLRIVSVGRGPDDPDRLTVANNLATAMAQSGAFVQAESLQRVAVEVADRIGAPDDTRAGASERLAITLANLGSLAEAEELERRSLTLYRKGLAANHPLVYSAFRNLGIIVAARGRRNEGLALLDSAIVRARAEGPAADAAVAYLVGQRVPMLLALRRPGEAARDAAIADRSIRQTQPEGSSRLSDADRWTAMAAFARGDYDRAVERMGAAVERMGSTAQATVPRLAQFSCLLGAALVARGQLAEGRLRLEESCARHEAWGLADPVIVAWGRAALRRVDGR